MSDTFSLDSYPTTKVNLVIIINEIIAVKLMVAQENF